MKTPSKNIGPYFTAFLALLGPSVQGSDFSEPEEALTWNLSEYQTETGAKWTTTQFSTIKGALYILTSSPDLENWFPVQSFYAVGHELHLALFEKEPAPLSEEGDTSPPLETTPLSHVSFILRSLPDGTGIAVTWRSFEESDSEEVIQKILPHTLDQAWENIPLFFDEFENHLIFIAALSHNPVEAGFTETTLENGTPDAIAFDVLQSHFTAIQQTVVANHINWLNNPVPPPSPNGNAQFYRLERTFPDSDGDGLSDAFEYAYGFDPSSGQGAGDGNLDPDGDGLTNEDEQLLGTNPNKKDTSENGIPDGAPHEWFLLNRSYNLSFEKSSPDAGEPDTSFGTFSYESSWDELLSGEGELADAPDFDSLGGALAEHVPFDKKFLGGTDDVFSDNDDPLGTSGYSGSVTEDEDSEDKSYSASIKHARFSVQTARPAPLKTTFPAVLLVNSGAGYQASGTSLTVAKDSSSGFLDFTPTFAGAAPASESLSQLLIPVTTKLKTHQAGYDNHSRLLDEHYEERPWLMVPAEGDRSNTFVLSGHNTSRLSLANAALTTSNGSVVTPATTGNKGSLDVQVKGPVPQGNATLHIEGVPLINLAFYPKRTIKLTVHAITLINDDVDPGDVKLDEGLPNQECIRAAADSTTGLWSTKDGDDDYSDGLTPAIHTGPNGICETTAAGNLNNPNEQDITIIEPGKGKPNVVFITGGPNGKINTPHDSQDEISAGGLHTGPDGIRQTKAIKQRISPINVPTAQELQDELNRIFGLQANIYFEVTLKNADVAYDVDHTDPNFPEYKHWGADGEFDAFDENDKETAEETELRNKAFDGTADFNLYFLPTRIHLHTLIPNTDKLIPFAKPEGWADTRVQNEQKAYVRASTDFFDKDDLIHTAAHEIGHLIFPNNSRGLNHPYEYKNSLNPSASELKANPDGFPLLKRSDDRRRLMWNARSLHLLEPGSSKLGTLLIKPEWDILHNVNQEP